MLLYTRLAPPKVPKRRSRAGCTSCKEKKKKCDETRPHCSRCVERGQDCTYEAVKPRQRRRKKSSGLGSDGASLASARRRSPADDGRRWLDSLEPDDLDMDSLEEGEDVVDGLLGDSASQFDFVSSVDPQLLLEDAFDLLAAPADDQQRDESTAASSNKQAETAPLASPATTTAASPTSPVSNMSLIKPAPVPQPRLEFVIPAFAEFTDRPNRRVLVDHFCNVLSHLIVLREKSGNPWQQLVLPLCYKSQTCMNAVYALASAHLEYRGFHNAEMSTSFHSQAIQGLERMIEQGNRADKHELLATIMLLVYYEVLVQKGRSNIVDGYLKGAMTVLSSAHNFQDPTGVFLERAFRFYDVIAALSFGTAPLSTTPSAGGLLPFPPLDVPPASPLSSVDTLLGMATTLWPIIHRLSNLRSLKDELEAAVTGKLASKAAVLRTEFETTSAAIESALKRWQPAIPLSLLLDDEDADFADADAVEERARLQSILNNALAYRHGAMVYLYRSIHGHSRRHALVQCHAHIALTHCVATVSHAGPMSALLWPLFVAACEAGSLADRDLARQAFVAVHKRQSMTNIERAWLIVQEVWRRADLMEAMTGLAGLNDRDLASSLNRRPDLWRRVSRDMGVTIVFG